MIKFISITLRNFMSYGNNTTVIQLDRSGTTLILGEDLDNTTGGTGANGVGKASSVNALVKTPTGWIRMGDIEEGQLLQMPDGSTSPVTGVYPQGVMPLYEVTFADGRSTTVTKEHLWTVFSHRWGRAGVRGEKTITTEELIRYLEEGKEQNNKPWYNIFVPRVTHPKCPDKELPIDPYLLGALLGDGGLSTPHISFTSADRLLIEECNNILKRDHQQILKYYNPKTNNGYSWVIGSMIKHQVPNNNIKNILKRLRLLGTKSNTKFIPQEYLEETSKQQKIDLLAGLLDTDGTVGKTKNVSFCTVSEQLALDVQYLVRSLGGLATITTRNPHYTDATGNKINGQVAYNVSIRYDNPRELFRLERKKRLLSEGRTQYANEGLRVVSVEQVEDGEAQCIMVSHPDHLYITDDFVVTHNTVIINALAYAVYGKPLSNISLDNLVNNINKKNMEVTVTFEKDGTFYHIKRVRKSKSYAAGNYVKYYVKEGSCDFTEDDEATRDSVANTNQMIEDVIGIPHELFSRIVVFSALHVPFLDLPVRHPTQACQTRIIEELFDLTTLTQKAEALKTIIKENEQRLEIRQAKTEQLEREIERHSQQVENAKQRVISWEVQNEKQIHDLESKLKRVADVDVELQQAAHAEMNKLKKQLAELISEQSALTAEQTRMQKDVTKYKKELGHLKDAKCPYCLQKFANAEAKIDELEDNIALKSEAIKKTGETIQKTEQEANRTDKLLSDVKKKIIVSDLDELLEIKNQTAKITEHIQELKQNTNPFFEPLEELEATKVGTVEYDETNALVKYIEHQKFLHKLLTKKDSFVRKALLNKNIPYLNKKLQQYLADLGLPHTVEFTHELTAVINQFGRPLDFGNLSNGQRARVNLALSLAFRDVLQQLHTKINVCMFDEVLDIGLDTVGVQAAAKMLKRKSRDENISLYIISHRDEINAAFDNIMTIQMTKGFSYIKEDQ